MARKKRRRVRTRPPASERARRQAAAERARREAEAATARGEVGAPGPAEPEADRAEAGPSDAPHEGDHAEIAVAAELPVDPSTESANEPTPRQRVKAKAERGGFRSPPPGESRRGIFGKVLKDAPESPYPRFGISVSKGATAVGASPVILVTAFLSAFVAWGFFAAIGAELLPTQMGSLMALLPSSFPLVDGPAVLGSGPETPVVIIYFAIAGVIRSVSIVLLITFLQAALSGRRPSLEIRGSFGRRVGAVWALYIGELGLIFVVPFALQFLGLGGLAPLLTTFALVFGLHLLVLAPVIAVLEEASPRDAIRLSIRAARLPGLRHFGLVAAYFGFVFYSLFIIPSDARTSVTPTIIVWCLTLAATFVHTVAMGSFVYRWLVARDEVPKDAPARTRR